MSKEEKSMFEKLYAIDVGEYIEKKNGLNYLSWAYAWAEIKKIYPDINYTIEQFGENHLPYVYDENTGYMVFTSVTINGLTHDMWLPVMDGANKARKKEAYTYDTKYKKGVRVEPATMFDINTAIMRCLVKNIAMFGLGLYIFAGEDLPETDENKIATVNTPKINNENAKNVIILINDKYPDKSEQLIKNICKKYGVITLFELTDTQLEEVKEKL